jgi:hypothetical protein
VSVKFEQNNQTVQTQYNAETIHIGATTSVGDMAQKIAALKAEVGALKELPLSVRQEVIGALAEAEEKTPSSKNTDIKSKLDAAGATLSTLDGATEKALNLARNLFRIGKWIAAII